MQQVNRDTLKFALKCSAIDRNGTWQNVYKNPKTDPTKASKGGRFNLVHNGKDFATVEVLEGESLTRQPSIRFERSGNRSGRRRPDAQPNLADVRAIATSYDVYDQAP